MKKYGKYGLKTLCCLLLSCAAVISSVVPAAGQSISEKENDAPCIATVEMREITHESICVNASSADYGAIAVEATSAEALRGLYLYPGGMPFGVKFYTDGVTVVDFCDVEAKDGKCNPASAAGICAKDVIIKVNGQPLSGASMLTDLIENCGGNALTLTIRRGGRELEMALTPAYCPAEGRYKTGIWVRDSGAGIGTVTFILPETGAFAGLGHGICDGESGALIPMKRGTVSDVTISSVVRGTAGKPGELKGYFNPGRAGTLLGNSNCGVWGVFTEVPETAAEPTPVGLRDEVSEGEAYILCSLDTNRIEKFDVRISNINREASGPKCFTVTVTDPDLIAATGGIVQGMSGSPIIQNGKLVGAVTHVLINDPSVGYGIFLENMLVNLPVAVR